MKFQFSEKKVRLPENVHAYAEKKVTKLDRYFNGDAEALVAFSVMKNRNQVELTVHAANTWFRARESTSDMFASIDAAVATIEGQIRKNKTRLARRLRQDAFVRQLLNPVVRAVGEPPRWVVAGVDFHILAEAHIRPDHKGGSVYDEKPEQVALHELAGGTVVK